MRMYRWPASKSYKQRLHAAPFVDRPANFHGSNHLVALGEKEGSSRWQYRVVLDDDEVASTLAMLKDDAMVDAIEHALVSHARLHMQPIALAKSIAQTARVFVREGRAAKKRSGQ